MKKIIFCMSLFVLFSCQKKPLVIEGMRFCIPYKVIVEGPVSPNKRKQILEVVTNCFSRADHVYNHWNPESEISLFNQGEIGSYECSKELIDLLSMSYDLYLNTNHKFDPGIGLIIQEWKYALDKGERLNASNLKKAYPNPFFSNFQLDNLQITKKHSNVYLDFDAIAKGYLIDTICESLEGLGIKNYFVEWGGEIKATEKKDHTAWNIAIRDPLNPTNTFHESHFKNKACATSGNYLQNWKIGNERYTHIIDPITLEPIRITKDFPISVTVFAESCALADGLATAACLFNNRKELDLWIEQVKKHYPDVSFLILFLEDELVLK